MLTCIVCQATTNKYKCPKCEEPYCSLNCFKQHKDAICEQTKSLQNPNDKIAEKAMDAVIHMPFKTEDTVPQEKLEELRHSEGLHNLLHNPHLRNFLSEIDNAPSAWKAMQVAMQEPLFLEFADECLKVVEPITAEEREEMRRLAA